MTSNTTKKRLAAVFCVCVIAAIFLAVGLGLGLSNSDDDDDSNTGSSGASTTPAPTVQTPAPTEPMTKDDEVLLFVVLDGFMPSYLSTGLAPTLDKLVSGGVHGKMAPSYPTVTFPNVATLFSGLYPEAHTLVGNRFYDPVFNDSFTINDQASAFQDKWWAGQPIWMVARNYSIKSALSNWLGPPGGLPDQLSFFSLSANYTTRVDSLIGFLNVSKSKRPRITGLYMEHPDSLSHFFGPSSPTTHALVKQMDNAVKYLLEQLDKINLRNYTNIVVISDHGMAEVNCTARGIDIQPMANYAGTTLIPSSEVAHVYVQDQAKKEELLSNFTCKLPYFYAYDKSSNTIPKRLHYQNHRRIGDIVLIPRDDYMMANNISTCPTYLGDHGFDNINPNMQATFIANGPAFLEGYSATTFPNIELFNLFADLLGFPPTENNGTYGSLHHTMKPEYRNNFSLPQMYSFMNRSYPDNLTAAVSACSNCICTDCSGALQSNIDTFRAALNLTAMQVSQSQWDHFPWSLPMSKSNNDDVIVLTQSDYVIGYSKSLKIPMWEGHKLTKSSLSGQNFGTTCFHKDIRLENNESSTCTQYEQSRFQRQPLAPMSDFRGDETKAINTNILSNIVPMYSNFANSNGATSGAWATLEEWVRTRRFTDLYVISGVIFDMDNDGLADALDQPKNWLNNQNNSVAIPTNYYKVIIKCATDAATIQQCGSDLDILAFILPHHNDTLCHLRDMKEYLGQHVARLRDVELLTGLNFLADLPPADQAKLKVQQHRTDEWPEQSNNQVA